MSIAATAIGAGVSLLGSYLSKSSSKPKTEMIRYEDLPPHANYSTGELPNPEEYLQQTYETDPGKQGIGNILSTVGPLIGSMDYSKAVKQPIAEKGMHVKGGQDVEVERNELIITPEIHEKLINLSGYDFDSAFGEIMSEGGYIPPSAPSHEEGGVDVTLPKSSFVLNKEQTDYVFGAKSPEDKMNRYIQTTNYLKEKGMPESGMADRGAYTGLAKIRNMLNTRVDPDIGMPKEHGFERGVFSDVPFGGTDTKGSVNENWKFGGRSAFGTGRQWGLGSSDVKFSPGSQQEVVDRGGGGVTGDPLQDAIDAQEKGRMFGRALDTGSIISEIMKDTTMPPESPTRITPLHTPTLKGTKSEDMATFKKEQALWNALNQGRTQAERMGAHSTYADAMMGALPQISAKETEIMNLNEKARAEASGIKREGDMQMSDRKYQKYMTRWAAEKDMQDKKSLAIKSILANLFDREGQADTNKAALALLGSGQLTSDEMLRVMLKDIFKQ